MARVANRPGPQPPIKAANITKGKKLIYVGMPGPTKRVSAIRINTPLATSNKAKP